LGGFLALSIASSKPSLLKSIVVVDSYPFLSLIFNPNATANSVIPQAKQMKDNIISIADSLYINQQRFMLKTMITDSLNVEKVLKWSLESDRKTTAQAMYEIMCTDLRDDLNKIKVPVFVFGSWYGYKDYGVTKESVYSNLKNQYSEAENCKFKVADKAKHFIMLDEPVWFITELKILLKVK
jgi:pimeloyl-ACP methyl ester carboxylesterase